MIDYKKYEAESLELLEQLISKAIHLGASEADAVLITNSSLSASLRLGKRESLERAESENLGLRVLFGKKQAIVSSNDTAEAALNELVDRAVAMARSATEDIHCGLAESHLLATQPNDLDLLDTTEPDSHDLFERASKSEEAARSVSGITNSEGANSTWGISTLALASSNGFSNAYSSSRHGVSVSVIAGEGTAMQRDYEFSSARFADDLENAVNVGIKAGERTVKGLNPRRVTSVKAPVIFEGRIATSLLSHLAAAISGPAIARGTSFLREALNLPVFAPGINIIDDPHRRRGLASRPWDGEGVQNEKRSIISDGCLATWLLDTSSAHQLGLTSTGHASRNTFSVPSPSPTNFYLEPGVKQPAELIADLRDGLYVTELIGFGVNGVTGDYSRGANGFWIEGGEITFPVSEVTIAGNLTDMFRMMTPATDLEFRYGMDSPTVRIDEMTVAGT